MHYSFRFAVVSPADWDVPLFHGRYRHKHYAEEPFSKPWTYTNALLIYSKSFKLLVIPHSSPIYHHTHRVIPSHPCKPGCNQPFQKKKKKTCEKYWNKAPFTPPATLSLYVASLCTVKLLVGVSNAVALILLVDFTSGHIYRKYNYKWYIKLRYHYNLTRN